VRRLRIAASFRRRALTVREAVSQANDLLTAHPNLKGIEARHPARA
jgi:hypothetical protein